MMKIVAVFNRLQKVDEEIQCFAPFADPIYTSRTADSVFGFAEALDLDFQSLKGLSMGSKKRKEIISYSYPGHASQWLKGAQEAVQRICNNHSNFQIKETALIISDPSIVASLIAHCRRTTDDESIMRIVKGLAFSTKGFVVFETESIGKDGIFKLKLSSY